MIYQVTGKFGIMVVSILLTLVVLEIGARTLMKPTDVLNSNDPETGRIYQKNFKGFVWEHEAGRETYIITNSLGYVGRDVELEKKNNVTRIAMLGDSMTAALQVDYYNNFSSLLASSLNADAAGGGKRFEILNYGIGGTGTFLQYQTYKKNISPYKPDAVFLIFFPANDYSENINKSNFDLENYKREGDQLTLVKSFLLRFELTKFILSRQAQINALLTKLILSETQNSALFLSMLNRVGFEKQIQRTTFTVKVSGRGGEFEKREGFYEDTFTIIDRLRKRVESDGTRFLVIILATEDLYEKSGLWKQEEKITKLIDFLEKEEIKYLNSAEPLASAKQEYPGKCFTNYCSIGHFNELGHEVFAKILYEVIQRYSI